MNEFEDVVFEEVAEKMERERKIEGYKIADPKSIKTIKGLKKFLCDRVAPPYLKGVPSTRKCKECESQCAYGRRLIELNEEIYSGRKKGEKETPKTKNAEEKETAPETIVVRMTPAQCRSAYAFIEEKLVASIVDGADSVTIGWISDMIGAMNAMKEAEW